MGWMPYFPDLWLAIMGDCCMMPILQDGSNLLNEGGQLSTRRGDRAPETQWFGLGVNRLLG